MSNFLDASKLVAKISTGIYAVECANLTFLQHPAKLKLPINAALKKWRSEIKRLSAMQSVFAATGSISALTVNYYEPNRKHLAAGLALFSLFPYTLIAILPVNLKLLDENLDQNSEEARKLLEKWGTLHSVRTAIGIISLAALLLS